VSGITAALAVNFIGTLSQNPLKVSPAIKIAMLAMAMLALVYILGAVLGALGVYRPLHRYTVGPDDLVPSAWTKEQTYMHRLSQKWVDYTIQNYRVNNRVNSLVSAAQQLLFRGVVLLGVVELALLTGQALSVLGLLPGQESALCL